MNNITAESINIQSDFELPTSSLIKCKKLYIGKNVVIDERTKIICPNGEVIIEDQTYIGNDISIILNSFKIGEYSKLHNHCLLNGKSNVSIGHNCWIGQNCILNGESDLIIGNNVGIGTYSSIWTHGYFGELIEGCTIYSVKPTIIEDDVWLVGSYNTIFPGLTIKNKTVLFGTSTITKNTFCNKVYSGNPAKDITEKVGVPYMEIGFAEKISIIANTLKNYFNSNKIIYQEIDKDCFFLPKLGKILFNKTDSDDEMVNIIFINEVLQWNSSIKNSLFCLKTKKYLKRYSQLEILVKKILNPTTARFIPYNKFYV